MGYFNIKLDDFHTEKFKQLKMILNCQTNDEVVKQLIMIAQTQLIQQKLFKSPKQPNQNNKTLKTEEKKE